MKAPNIKLLYSFRLHNHLIAPFLFATFASGLVSAVHAKPIQIQPSSLTPHCQRAISSNRPDDSRISPINGPEIYRDRNGDLSIGWSSSSGSFYRSGDELKSFRYGSRKIGASCPKVHVLVLSGPSGGSEKLLLRRDVFTELHYRDSGYPGDKSKYWKWDTVPFSYDPNKTY